MKFFYSILFAFLILPRVNAQITIGIKTVKECVSENEDIIFEFDIRNHDDAEFYLLRSSLNFFQSILSEDGEEINIRARILAVYTEALDNSSIVKSKYGDLLYLPANSAIKFHEKQANLFEVYQLKTGSQYIFRSSYGSFMKKKKHKRIPIISDEISINDLGFRVCD